ncbi:Uncharacterized protein HZ326_17988 [Fusarium oxysporum f. sp. albedinis]|nr:Uncharacterized protein HZ326_17988 [Fusarium oxysporum f. sp. albedinis]
METHSDDRIISRLACDIELDRCKVIHAIIPAKLSAIHPERPVSSLGLLDTLPAELLVIALELLDFQSLSRLSRACLRGKRVVENYVPYQQVIQHAPKVPTALTKTNLVGYYPASAVYRTLRTHRCVSCSEYGAFLYLPTCERVCLECLFQNRGLWMMTPKMATWYFRLTRRQVQTLPIMDLIPGMYSLRGPETVHGEVFQLVNVKMAKRLAIEVHGSMKNLNDVLPRQMITSNNTYLFFRYREAPLEGPGCDPWKLPEQRNMGDDPYAGVSSLRVPYITDSRADWGQLCKACEIAYKDFRKGSLPLGVLAGLRALHRRPGRPLFAWTTKLHSRHGLLAHAKDCYGAQKLLKSSGDQDQVEAPNVVPVANDS